MWEVRQVESGSQRNWEGNQGTGRGGRGKPPGAGAGGGGLSYGDSVWKRYWNYSRRPVRTCACTQGHERTHAPWSPRNAGSSQKPLNNRSHTLEGMGTMESVSGGGRGAGFQKDQPDSLVPPTASEPHRTRGTEQHPSPIQPVFCVPYSGLGPVETIRNMVPALRGNQSASQGKEITDI